MNAAKMTPEAKEAKGIFEFKLGELVARSLVRSRTSKQAISPGDNVKYQRPLELLKWEKFRSELYPVLPFSLDSTGLTWSKVV